MQRINALQDANGSNLFAVTDEQLKAGGREDARYEDMKLLSQEGEWFLAGLLEGLPDGSLQALDGVNSVLTL